MNTSKKRRGRDQGSNKIRPGMLPHCQQSRPLLRRKNKLRGRARACLQRGISQKSLFRSSLGMSAKPMPFLLYSNVSTDDLLELLVQAMVSRADSGSSNVRRRSGKTPSKSSSAAQRAHSEPDVARAGMRI